ncbi:MAG: hypothetical protein JKY81_01740 [Colwellia sp.]|nr:hypothetical protein [Colwellia sp.]
MRHEIRIRGRSEREKSDGDEFSFVVEVVHGIDGPANILQMTEDLDEARAFARGVVEGIRLATSAVTAPLFTGHIYD